MSLIRPFAGLRPAPGRADEVIAPPYDVLDTEEARARAADKPFSFLHVSKAEIDLAPGTDPHDPGVYAKAKENFERMLAHGILQRDPAPYYYFYRLTLGAHTQTGLVVAASIDAYEADRIRKHEFTRPDKEDDRVHQIEAINAQTGPVFVTYRHSAEVDRIAREVTASAPAVDVSADDGVRHALWVVQDRDTIEALTGRFAAMPALYIADGHHRSAAAARVAARRRAGNPRHTGQEAYNFFLSVMFPDDQTQILDYNRVVKDLNQMAPPEFLARLQDAFVVDSAALGVKPAERGEFGLYLQGQWYRLRLKPERIPADPVARLDVSLLQDQVLAPILGIADVRRDRRIDFVGGIRGLRELERRVDSGEMAAGFALHPTSLDDLMAVADAGRIMPPKSTWFEPKLADGLVSYMLD